VQTTSSQKEEYLMNHTKELPEKPIEKSSKTVSKFREIRNELGRLASIDIEARKLKDASSQIDFKLDCTDSHSSERKSFVCSLCRDESRYTAKKRQFQKGKSSQ
jgi:hypothetical protein